MAWSGRALPGLADPHQALAGYRAVPAQDVGGRPEENAPVLGQPRDAQAITDRAGYSSHQRRLRVANFTEITLLPTLVGGNSPLT